jgi:hypothetical protein
MAMEDAVKNGVPASQAAADESPFDGILWASIR